MITELGDSIFRMTFDVPIPGTRPVNVYLVGKDEPILIDCGVGDDKTYDEMSADLARIGLRIADLRAILVTHQHVDHVGLATRLSEESGAPFYLYRDDWSRLTATDDARERDARELREIVVYWGVPAETAERIAAEFRDILSLGGGRISPERLTSYPPRLRVGGIELEVIHCPGHTKGLVCLWWPDKKVLFSNDHILEDITPNTTIYVPRYRQKRCGLGHYLESLGYVRDLPVEVLLPGHGEPYRDVAGRVDQIRAAAVARRGKILTYLTGSAMTIQELIRQVWEDLSPLHTFLAAREVHGHLEILSDQDEVEVEERDGVGRFRRRNAH